MEWKAEVSLWRCLCLMPLQSSTINPATAPLYLSPTHIRGFLLQLIAALSLLLRQGQILRVMIELVQHFACWGSSHCTGARVLLVIKIDMVWPYRSPIPVGKKGGVLLVLMEATCLRGA